MSHIETSSLICIANQWTGFYISRRSGVFIVNFEHILHIVLMIPLLTLNNKISADQNKFINAKCLSVNFEHNST